MSRVPCVKYSDRVEQVCADLNARILIDDSSENALQCATAIPVATRVLLFGDYEWNKRISGAGDASDDMSFDIRLKSHGGKEFWKAVGQLQYRSLAHPC